MVKLDVHPNERVSVILDQIAAKISVPVDTIQLYLDERFEKPIRITGNMLQAGIRGNSIIYADIKAKTDVPVAQGAEVANYQDEYLAGVEEVPDHIKRLQHDYGPKIVTTSFLEFKESQKPQIVDQEESSCYAIRIGEEALKPFQNDASRTNFSKMHMGFLFGRINKVTGKVTVHCLMEPPQENFADHFTISDTFDITGPLAIAGMFGMECVGMAVSWAPPDRLYPVTEQMVRLMARFQNMFSEYFTLLVVKPHNEQEIEVEAFQVSDAAMKLEAGDYFIDSDDPKHVSFKEEIKVYELRRSKIDLNYLLCAVRVRKTRSRFVLHSFYSPSEFPTVLNLKQHLMDNEYAPLWYALFDFNLLVYLEHSHILSIDEIMNVVHQILLMDNIDVSIAEKIQTAIKGV